MSTTDDNTIFSLSTEHVMPLKLLLEVLKEILTDVNIEFYSEQESESNDKQESDSNDKQDGCIRIKAVDPTKTVLISMKLDAKQFHSYICNDKKIVLGINLPIMNKLFKTIDKEDILTMYYAKDDKEHINIQVENPEKGKRTNDQIKLLDLDTTHIDLPKIVCDAVITMSAAEFHKICREMYSFGEYVDIRCTANSIEFKCTGDAVNRSISYTKGNLVNIVVKNNKIVQGIYELKHIVLFTKCANLCDEIQIFMNNNFPLIIRYTIATLGKLWLCITHITRRSINNYDDEGEE
jgi:proliferating cell nuclear antigen PCNA